MNHRELIKKLKSIRFVVFDFDGVFTDNTVLVLQDGSEGVSCNRSDGLGVDMLKKMGLFIRVISTEKNPVVAARCRKLGINCIQGCNDKLFALKKEIKAQRISMQEVAYLGNDINDKDCLRSVGFPACVRDSHPELLKTGIFITKNNGGKGAVREFCDMIREAHDE
jgi:3-deoxy-D-manno-octulosonate 8-phosphate phosphatase (KDO 8-P phosphatase)